MGLTTTTPLVIAKLLELYENDGTLGAIQIIEGDTGGQTEYEHLALLGNPTPEEQAWAALGARSRDEEYILDHRLSVRRPGDQRDEARTRIFELLAAVEDIARANVNILTAADDPEIKRCELEISQAIYQPFIDDEGFSAQISFSLRVQARI